MNWKDRIVTDARTMVGKPCVKGTRMAVEFILGSFADGWSEKEVLVNYPHLTPDDLRAVFGCAAACATGKVHLLSPANS